MFLSWIVDEDNGDVEEEELVRDLTIHDTNVVLHWYNESCDYLDFGIVLRLDFGI